MLLLEKLGLYQIKTNSYNSISLFCFNNLMANIFIDNTKIMAKKK